MKVFIEKENKNVELVFSGTGKELCEKINIELETVLIVRNGEIITEDISLNDDDSIELLSVISGG